MIDSALKFVGQQLNVFLKDGSALDRVVVGPLIRQDGTIPTDNDDKIVMSLVNIEQDRDVQNSPTRNTDGRSSSVRVNRPIILDLHILLAASFKDYATGLKYLSKAIAFLQANPLFNQSSPGFPKGIERLAMTMANVGYSELSHLWNGLGAKYMPSSLYLMRMVALEVARIGNESPVITGQPVDVSRS